MNLLSEKETIEYSGGAKITMPFANLVIGVVSFVYGIIDGILSRASSCRR